MEGWSLEISHEKYIKDGKVLDHLGCQSKVFFGPLTDWSAWVGFCTSSPQQNVKYQLWYLNFVLWRGGVSINISWKIYQGRQSSCHLGFKSKVLPGPLTDWSAWVGFCTSSPQQGVKYQLWYLIFFYGGGALLISHEKYIKDGKVLDQLWFMSKVLPGPLTDLSAWVGFCTSSPQ